MGGTLTPSAKWGVCFCTVVPSPASVCGLTHPFAACVTVSVMVTVFGVKSKSSLQKATSGRSPVFSQLSLLEVELDLFAAASFVCVETRLDFKLVDIPFDCTFGR